jgi:chromosome segregation ATPase
MLLLSDASSIVFLKFLQIFLWISIPAFLIGMLITTLTHYSNKRKKQKESKQPFIFEDDASYAGYDEVSLIPLALQASDQETKKIMNYLSFSTARYIAMQKDFKFLTEKYQQLQANKSYINQNLETKNNDTMETIHTDLQQIPGQQIDLIRQQQHEIEKRELLAELDQLTVSYENLEKDNNSLREQLNVYCENGTGFTSMIQKWEEEKAELKRRISEQEYLKDVLDEKKQQIAFLQQQLEQRIKNHHLVEQQFRELGIKFMEANEKLEIKEQSDKEFQAAVHDKEQEIILLKEALQSATAKAAQLETTIKEWQEQHSKFSFELEEKNNLVSDLHAQLAEANEAKIKLEERLERSQTFIKGFHRKLSDILQEEIPESPVIVMKPVYKQENIGEQITESAIQ